MPTLTPRVHEAGASRLVSYDFGAHLASWTVDGEPVVWMSDRAVLDGSAPLRGGVPICFPWFAAGPSGDLSPSHGVVRTATWRAASARADEVWAWELSSRDVAQAAGAEHLPGAFELRHSVGLTDAWSSSPGLRVALTVSNPAEAPLRAEVALHTYLAVADVRSTRVGGLDGADYLDKVLGARARQVGPVTFDGETDRVYDSPGTATGTGSGSPAGAPEGGVVVDDGRRRLHLRPHGAGQTVVWNPWAQKAVRMRDLGDEDWTRFVCVETAATADHALVLPAGGRTTVAVTLTVDRSLP